MRGKVILASNRLPVMLTEQDGKLTLGRSIGGVATALDGIFRRYNSEWVGWTGLRRVLSSAELAKLKFPDRLVPVQADADLVRGYYDHFANCWLWPIMHCFTPRSQAVPADWEAMREIARRFAAAIKKVARPSDVIWVHDYHLLLVPAALRALGVTNRIGYFWHSPLPPPGCLTQLPHLDEILESIYEIDVLGLQTRRDVDNFWEVMRAVGDGRQPGLVRAFPIGIDYETYHNAYRRTAVQERVRAIQRKHKGKRIIFSVSRLDYTKGILTEVRAVARFFDSLPPKERRQYVYKLCVAPSREDVAGYLELKAEIEREVRACNKRLGNRRWQPIDFVYENFGFEDMVAWYIAAQVLLLTPAIDGMNLIAKEYVAAHRSGDGMLVLSNTMGSAFQLTDALLVDADDIAATAKAIAQAFAMPEQERVERWHRLQTTVQVEDAFWWANRFLQALTAE